MALHLILLILHILFHSFRQTRTTLEKDLTALSRR